MGIVVCNSKGDCLNIRAKQKSFCLPIMIESEAALSGIHMTISMGIKKLVIEGNAKIVINAMKEPLEECPNEKRNCIHECKELLKSVGQFWSILFTAHSKE